MSCTKPNGTRTLAFNAAVGANFHPFHGGRLEEEDADAAAAALQTRPPDPMMALRMRNDIAAVDPSPHTQPEISLDDDALRVRQVNRIPRPTLEYTSWLCMQLSPSPFGCSPSCPRSSVRPSVRLRLAPLAWEDICYYDVGTSVYIRQSGDSKALLEGLELIRGDRIMFASQVRQAPQGTDTRQSIKMLYLDCT